MAKRKAKEEEKQSFEAVLRERSLVVSDLHSEMKGSWFESGCLLCAEVNSLQ